MYCNVAVAYNCTESMLGVVRGLVGLYSKLLSHYLLVYDILDQATCSLIFFVINDLGISWILKLRPEVFNYKKNKKRKFF